MTRVLCHMNFGEAPSIIKVGDRSRYEHGLLILGLLTLFGGELREAQRGIASFFIRRDWFFGVGGIISVASVWNTVGIGTATLRQHDGSVAIFIDSTANGADFVSRSGRCRKIN